MATNQTFEPNYFSRIARFILHALPLYNGKGRLIDRTPLGKLSFGVKTLDVEALDGFTIRIIPDDLIGRQIFLTGCFDRSVSDVLIKIAQPGDCLWDIGANIGYISCTFLNRVENSRCLSIEPLPDVHALLCHNLEQFGEPRAKSMMAAVSENTGLGRILQTHGNIGHSHLISYEQHNDNIIEVNLISGDDLLYAFGPPNLIKIDVEGHETQVIRGLSRVIEENQPRAIIFETHGGWPRGELAQQLKNHDYRILCIAKSYRGWSLVTEDEKLSMATELSSDFVAVPNVSYAKLLGLHRFSRPPRLVRPLQP